MLEKTLESPLDCKEIHPVHSKGDQPWVFFGRNDAKAETPVLWPPHGKSWLTGKDSDAGRDWGQEVKRTTRGWDGWMASLTQWTWVWVNSGRWSQRVGHDWVTELNGTERRRVGWASQASPTWLENSRKRDWLRILLQLGSCWSSLVIQAVKNLPVMWETKFDSWVRKSPWRKQCPPTPVFLPGESPGQRSLVGYSQLDHK